MENQIENMENNEQQIVEVPKAKETNAEYQKRRYRENRAKHLQYCLTKVMCDVCNCEVTRCNMQSHKRTVKHAQNAEIQKLKQPVNPKV